MVVTTLRLPGRGNRKPFTDFPQVAQAAIRDPQSQAHCRRRAYPARPPWAPALRCTSAGVADGFEFGTHPSHTRKKPDKHHDHVVTETCDHPDNAVTETCDHPDKSTTPSDATKIPFPAGEEGRRPVPPPLSPAKYPIVSIVSVIPEAAQAAIRDHRQQPRYRRRVDLARPPWVPAISSAAAGVTEGFIFRASPAQPCE